MLRPRRSDVRRFRYALGASVAAHALFIGFLLVRMPMSKPPEPPEPPPIEMAFEDSGPPATPHKADTPAPKPAPAPAPTPTDAPPAPTPPTPQPVEEPPPPAPPPPPIPPPAESKTPPLPDVKTPEKMVDDTAEPIKRHRPNRHRHQRRNRLRHHHRRHSLWTSCLRRDLLAHHAAKRGKEDPGRFAFAPGNSRFASCGPEADPSSESSGQSETGWGAQRGRSAQW